MESARDQLTWWKSCATPSPPSPPLLSSPDQSTLQPLCPGSPLKPAVSSTLPRTRVLYAEARTCDHSSTDPVPAKDNGLGHDSDLIICARFEESLEFNVWPRMAQHFTLNVFVTRWKIGRIKITEVHMIPKLSSTMDHMDWRYPFSGRH